MKATAHFILIFLFFSCTTVFAQSNQVKIEIPGKSDLIFNGKSLQILDPDLVIGQDAGANLGSSTLDNTLIGLTAGKSMSTGRANTFLGARTGYNNNGVGNVFLGSDAGYYESGDDKLYISNSSTSSPLIWGDFRAKKIIINDNLEINKDLEVGTDLDVGGFGEMTGLTLFATNPSLKFKSGSTTPFTWTYDNSSQQLELTESGVTGEVMTVKNGEVSLPQYDGTGDEALYVDENGKILRKAKVNQTFNVYNFFDPVQLSGAVKYRLGIQLPDGIALTGISGFVLDNEPGTNTGIQNTPYISIERESKTDRTLGSEEIFRIEGVNTATDVFQSITTTYVIGTNRNIIDNSTYIYYFEIFMCPECDFTEITILE